MLKPLSNIITVHNVFTSTVLRFDIDVYSFYFFKLMFVVNEFFDEGHFVTHYPCERKKGCVAFLGR